MKLLLALLLVIPSFAQANFQTAEFEGASAESILLGLAEHNFATANGAFELSCRQEAKKCRASIEASAQTKSIYLYQTHEARMIYELLRGEEFETRLGKMKIFKDASGRLEILCSQSPVPGKERHSCTIKLETSEGQ